MAHPLRITFELVIDRVFEDLKASANHTSSLRDGAVATVNLYRTRLELLLLDLEEEKERLEQRLILTAIAASLLGLGSLVATGFFVALLWPSIGAWAIAIFAGLYLGAAGAVLFVLRRRNQERHRTFACTLREFEKDADRFARVLEDGDSTSSDPRSRLESLP